MAPPQFCSIGFAIRKSLGSLHNVPGSSFSTLPLDYVTVIFRRDAVDLDKRQFAAFADIFLAFSLHNVPGSSFSTLPLDNFTVTYSEGMQRI